MAYQVIARKWRPQTFDEVTGQEAITRTLRNAIEHDRLHHAYLFSGARGVGKTTTARLLAKAVNCRRADGPTATPCAFTDPQACASCREVAEGRSIDVLEIDAASNTGVDNVRDAIINTVGIRPARDRYRVFIIDEVHMLSGAAFNALLKTLEEPPPSVLFIMATTESHKLPDTILSRCQQFEFRTIAAAKIAERLRHIAVEEKIKVSDDALREIARAGEGSMRDAQSAFDQVISFSEGEIETKDVETALGVAGVELRARVMRAVAAQKPSEALGVVDDLAMRGHDLRNFCRDLLAHLRDLLVVKVTGDGTALADLTEAERRELSDEAGNFSESDLVRFFHSLTETEKHLRESAHPRYQLEIGLVKLIEMRRLAPLGRIVERLGALEEALRTGNMPAGSSGPAPASPASSGSGGALPHRAGGAGGVKTTSAEPAQSATPATNGYGMNATAAAGGVAATGDGNVTTGDVPAITAGNLAGKSNEVAATVNELPVTVNSSAASGDGAAANGRDVATKTPEAESTAPVALKEKSSAPLPTQQRSVISFAVPPPPSSIGAAASVKSTTTTTTAPAPPARPPVPAMPAPSGLKLVPTPTPNEARSDVPFPVANYGEPRSFFETSVAPRSPVGVAGEDHVGLPLAFDGLPSAADAAPEDDIARIKKALDARRKPFLVAALEGEGVREVRLDADELYVEYAPEGKHLRALLAKPDNMCVLREVCCEVLGRDMGVRVIVKTPGESDDMPLTEQDEAKLELKRLRERADSLPLVNELLKTCRGEIVDVSRFDG